MADYVFLTLLVVHILAIVGWMGATFLFSTVLGPSLSGMEPGGRAEFLRRIVPRYTRFVIATAVISIVFGGALYGYAYAYAKNLPAEPALTFLQAGSALGLIAFVVALSFMLPAARIMAKMLTENKGGNAALDGKTGVLSAMQSRVRLGTISVTVLLFIVLVLMIVGASL